MCTWCELLKIVHQIRVVKRSSDLRTSNFKFEFVFIFQPFDIRIQASLIRHRRFCLESGAHSAVHCVMISLFSAGHCLFAYPSPPLSSLHTAAFCCILMQAIKVTNLGGPDTEQTSNANCLSFSTNI